MRELTISINGFPFIDLLKISLYKTVNEHATGLICGHIPPEQETSIIKDNHVGDSVNVEIFGEQGDNRVIFSGIILNFDISIVNGLHLLTLKLISRTYLADLKPHIRTFQDSTMTYGEVVKTISEDSGNIAILVPTAHGRPIERMFVQYEETDWEFCKRIASRLNTYVLPNYLIERNCFYVGMNPAKEKATINTVEYSVKKSLREYLVNDAAHVPHYREKNAMYYQVTSREIYELCDQISLNDIPNQLFVYAIQTELQGAHLVHQYTLKEKCGFSIREQFNQKLIGASLLGQVIEIDRDKVRVKIFDDVKQKQHKWFLYSTVYSSPDNTGWYFMPEIGDKIRLHLPNEHEEDSYVISCVHMGDRAIADIKSIRTKYQKEVIFYPDSIYISNGTGSYMELHDENGITISSNKDISIQSEKDITIQGQSQILVMADKGVTIQQSENQIKVDDVIDITAGHVRVR